MALSKGAICAYPAGSPRFLEAPDMLTELPSVCPMDCPDTCSLLVTVEDNRVLKVRGSKANPFTRGVVCNKVARGYPEYVHGANRLSDPLRRIGAKGEGRFEPISWNQALDTIHEHFTAIIAQYGPQAIAPLNYAGPHGALGGGSMDARFFHRLGASLLKRGPLCGGIKSEAYDSLFGAMPGTLADQAQDARLIVVWSNNVTVSNLHFAGIIERARRKGAKLVVIDPKRIKIAEQADLFLPIRPGTDVVLAWAITDALARSGDLDQDFIARWVQGYDPYMARVREFPVSRAAEICGVPQADIERFVAMYRELTPSTISIGNGLERNRNGGAGMRAVLALATLAGRFGDAGGGVIAKPGNAFPGTPDKLQRPDLVPAGTRVLNIVDIGGHLLDPNLTPPIKGLFIYNHNPVITHPDQNRMKRGLVRDDLFTVGCDVEMNDTMAYCDIVLPASSHFEFDDIYAAYGQTYLQRAEPVIAPVGQSLPNTEIFRRLAARFGFDGPVFTASDAQLMDDAYDGDDPRLGGHRPSALPVDSALAMTVGGDAIWPFKNVFPTTRSGKVELSSATLEDLYGQALPEYVPLQSDYALTLITPSSDKRINATFGGLAASDGVPELEIHPDDAAARGLGDGMAVTVWNDLGTVHLILRVSDAMRPGVVYSPKGAWFKTSDIGQTVSALAPATKADIAGGACYNDCRVEIAARAAP
jgi:anaerobic selenocysteine-containing dehydrogenase